MSVLGVVGAVVGGIYGGPQGAMLGYSIGAGVDSVINPPKIEGPRLDELEMQMSNYGSPIPIEWGTNRHAGTVIWPKVIELKEHEHNESAKGGPEVTSYTYTVTMAVLICEGPIKGVRRIWANKKLVYDISDGTGTQLNPDMRPVPSVPTPDLFVPGDGDGENGMGGGSSVSSQQDPAIGTVRFYLGTEDQEPDPLIVAIDGPSPAYKGYAYVVFEDYDLSDSINRPPQFEFEVVTEGEQGPPAAPVKFGNYDVNGNIGASVIDPDRGTLWVRNGGRGSTAAQTGGAQDGVCINVYDLETKELLAIISNGRDSGTTDFGNAGHRDYGDLSYANGVVYTTNPTIQILAADAAYGFNAESMTQAFSVSFSQHPENVFWPVQAGTIAAASNGTILSVGAGSYSGSAGLWTPESGLITYQEIEGMGATQQALALDDGRVAIIGINGLFILQPSDPIIESARVPTADFNGNAPSHLAYDRINGRLLVVAGGLWAVDVANGGAVDNVTEIYSGSPIVSSIHDPVAKMYYVASYDSVTAISANSYAVSRTVPLSPMSEPAVEMHFSEKTGELILVGATSVWALKVNDVLAPSKIPLSKIVGDICKRAGLTDSDINISQLTDLVDGYAIPRQMSGRSAIEPLQVAFYFDAVESDDKIKFVKRGAGAPVLIPMEDRAARDFGGDLPDSLSIVRAQDMELPVQCDVEYSDIDADHLVGNQYARRLAKDTKQRINIQTPVVMGATKAKQVAEVTLYRAWLNQTYKFTTSRKYAHLEPTDLVALPTAEAAYTARITAKREQPSGVIEWEASMEQVEVYTQSGAGAVPTSYVPQAIYRPSKTALELMDIPLLRDQDAGKGFPVAMAGTTASWPGAQLFKSSDSGSTYGALFSQSESAVIGRATNALGDFTGGDIFDDGNSVTVKINPGGQLTNYTEAQLLSGVSAFALGENGRWEIVQYRTATLVAPLTYTLTGLLRGRKGTEWATGTHQAGDHFVMLNTGGIQFYDPGAADLNVQRLYKAPAFRSALSSAVAVPFTDTQVRLRPYSVANLRIDPAADGYLVSWAGRSILGGGWSDGGDVVRDATFVAYDVTILKSDGTAVKAYSVANESFSYTSAMASLDLGLSSAAFSVRVAQRNSDYGQGVGVTVSSDGAAFSYDVPAPQQTPGTPGAPGAGSSLIAVKSMQMRVQSGSPYSAGSTSAPPYYIRSSLIYQAPNHGLKVGDYVWRQKMPELMYKTGLNPIGPFGDAEAAPPASGAPAYRDFLIFNRVREVTADTFTLYDLNTFQTEYDTSSYLRYTWEWVTFAAGTVQKVMVDGSALVVDDPFTQPLPSEYVRPLSPTWAKLWDGSQFIAEAWGPDDLPGNDTQRLMVSAAGTSGWELRPASVSGHGRMTFGNGRHVAWNGWFGVSTDNLQTWTRKPLWDFPLRQLGGGVQFANVQFVNGQFVAVGEYGVIVASSDGLNWTETDDGTGQQYRDKMNLMSVAFDGTHYVVAGYLPKQTPVVLRGTSLGSLVSVPMPHIGPTFVTGFWGAAADVAYDAGRFVVVGLKLSVADGTPEVEGQIRYQPYIATSTDGGATWTDVTCPSTFPKPTECELSRVVHCNGIWLATGNNVSATSTDGVNWTEIKHLGTNRYGTVTNGSMVMTTMNIAGAIENNMIWTSTDCVNWTQVPV